MLYQDNKRLSTKNQYKDVQQQVGVLGKQRQFQVETIGHLLQSELRPLANITSKHSTILAIDKYLFLGLTLHQYC